MLIKLKCPNLKYEYYKKVIGKHTPNITNIAGHSINAGDRSTIATDNAKIDQSISISDSNIRQVSEHMDTINMLVGHITESELPRVTKNHAELLSESISKEVEAEPPNEEKIQGYVKDIIALAESTKPIAELVISGIKLLKSVF